MPDPLAYGSGLGGAVILALIVVALAAIDTIITHHKQKKDKDQ